jgi:SNF2 family DNA or RNA helicase
VWDREIFQYFPHLTTAVLHGTRAKRHDMLASDKHIYIVNHDGVELILKEVLERGDIDCVVIDELAVYRNARTARWKALNPIVSKAKFAWGLTGSPTPGEPTDAWGQVKMLRPTQVPKYFKEFQRDTMIQVSPFRWVPKKEANEKVFSVMQPCVRFTRDDCVELPDTSYQTRETPLSTQQQKIHDEMIKKLRLEFAQGRVTAANEGVLVSKLLQICAGWVYTQDRRVIALDNKPRLQALQDFLDEAEGKVIVFGSYIHVVENLFDIIKKSGRTCSMVHGGTPGGQRNAIFSAFNQDPDPRILVAHPGCMAHGLTLTSASVTVWFTPAPSLEIYEQANARMTRPGQEKKTVIAHLTGSKTESKLYQRLRQRASVQGALLEMFENQEVG